MGAALAACSGLPSIQAGNGPAQRNVPNSNPQTAAIAYDVLLDPQTGFTRDARISEAGTQTVLALRESYGKPTKKLQGVPSYYDSRFYDMASR